ncbi:hypothetical protein J4468_01375 [Candidatus Woesearchaeota archaeon]|nr:hypothetical protein [Candidatus Woesearchaeota archaeon]
MDLINRLITVLIFFTLIASAVSASEVIDLNFTLAKITYAPNVTLDGTIKLTFNNQIKADETITLKVKKLSQTYNLFDLFQTMNLKPTKTQPVLTEGTSHSSLIFNLANKETKEFGLRLPKDSIVDNADFNITGQQYSGSFPFRPTIDVGEEGYADFEYMGSLQGYSSIYYYADGLDESASSENTIIGASQQGYSYCERVSIQKTKHIRAFVKYGLATASSLPFASRASIYKFDTPSGNELYLQSGVAYCNLPNVTSITTDWQSCVIEEPSGLFEGEYLLCFNVISGTPISSYNLVSESRVKAGDDSSGYICVSDSCAKDTPNDYFIKFQIGTYDSALKTTVPASNWTTFPTAIALAINNYLSDCVPYDSTATQCMVPSKIAANSSGSLILDNLYLKYTKSSGSSQISNIFYDIEITPSYINTISSKNITNYTITIPLALYFKNITTPFAEDIYSAEVSLSTGVSAALEISVTAPSTISNAEIVDAIKKAEELEYALDSIPTSSYEMLKIIDLDILAMKSEIQSQKASLQSLSSSTINDSLKGSQAGVIAKSLDELYVKVPKTVAVSSVLSSLYRPRSSSEVPSVIDDPETVFTYQNAVNVLVNSKRLSITMMDGSSENYAYIIKAVKSLKELKNAKVYEIIPKEFASSASEVFFSEKPEIVEDDPIVYWSIVSLAKGQAYTFSYIIKGDYAGDAMSARTIIVSSDIGSGELTTTCGDGICALDEDESSCPADCFYAPPVKGSNFIWLYLLLGLIIVALIVAAVFLFKKKEEFPSMFKTALEYKHLKGYVLDMRSKKHTFEEIKKKLASARWTEKHINIIIAEVQREEKSLNSKPKE